MTQWNFTLQNCVYLPVPPRISSIGKVPDIVLTVCECYPAQCPAPLDQIYFRFPRERQKAAICESADLMMQRGTLRAGLPV